MLVYVKISSKTRKMSSHIHMPTHVGPNDAAVLTKFDLNLGAFQGPAVDNISLPTLLLIARAVFPLEHGQRNTQRWSSPPYLHHGYHWHR